MEKNQIVKLVSRIKDRFPDEFFRLSKEEKYEYVETFEKLFIRFDFDLVDKAISRIFDMRYIKAPTFMQMQLSVSRMLFERRSDVFVKMRNHGYYERNLTGSPEEIEKQSFKIWDNIAIEFLKDEISEHHKLEILTGHVNALKSQSHENKGLGMIDLSQLIGFKVKKMQ